MNRSGSHGRKTSAFWVLGPAATYGQVVRGARVSLPGLASGRYQVTWRDDVTGAVVARVVPGPADGTLTLDVPPFVRHLAAILAPVENQ